MESGELRKRMVLAIKAHNTKYGRGKRPDLFRKILTPSFHLTQKEREDEEAWVQQTDQGAAQGNEN